MPSASFQRVRSIAATALVGLGIFILYQNLAGMVVGLRHVLSTYSSEPLGVPSAAIQAFSQVVRSYSSNHQRFLGGSLHHMWVLSWPLLLVSFGRVLWCEDYVPNPDRLPQKKNCVPVDSAARGSTSK